jgi:hypothetical protein
MPDTDGDAIGNRGRVQIAEMPATDVSVIETETGIRLQGCLPQMLMLLKDRGGR